MHAMGPPCDLENSGADSGPCPRGACIECGCQPCSRRTLLRFAGLLRFPGTVPSDDLRLLTREIEVSNPVAQPVRLVP